MADTISGSGQDLIAGDWSQHYAVSNYPSDYNTAGYNSYLTKSIDLTTQMPANAISATLSTPAQYSDNNINYSQSVVSGALGDIIQVGNITIDGSIGRITIRDGSNIEVVRIGLLDDL